MALPQYATREITHGDSYGAYSEIIQDPSTGTITFGSPKVLTGLRAVSIEESEEESKFYADNVEHLAVAGNTSIEGSIKLYQIEKDFIINHLGKVLEDNGGISDGGIKKNFVFQYLETITNELGEETEQLTIYYNCRAGKPTAEAATDEDAVEAKEFEIPITALVNNAVKNKNGKSIATFVLRKDSTNEPLFDLAYSQVILPDTPIPTPPPIVP